MTPFQRQVIDAARKAEHEAQQRQQEEMQQQYGQGGPTRNARAGGSPGGDTVGDRKETVRYINREEYPDHPAHDDE